MCVSGTCHDGEDEILLLSEDPGAKGSGRESGEHQMQQTTNK